MKDLLNFASLMDISGRYDLSDKLVKIAQNQSNFSQMPLWMKNRKLQELTYLMQQHTLKGKELWQKYKSGEISQADFNKEYDEWKKIVNKYTTETQNINQQISQSGNLSNSSSTNGVNDTSPAHGEVYDVRELMSNSPEEFVAKLFAFSRQNNISNLAQAFDNYAKSGAMYQATYLQKHDKLSKLYNLILNTPRIITQQELVAVLKNLMSAVQK